MNTSPGAFSMNQNPVLCLPVLSESQKVIWVPADQIEAQLGDAAELNRAFDRFPYLTRKQAAALVQHCSLHPDQEKVWFMLQRLRYGISWDSGDIIEVQKKLNSNEGNAQGKQHLQIMMGEKVKEKKGEKKKKREVQDGTDGKKTRKVTQAKVKVDEQNQRRNEQLMTKVKERKVEESTRNPRKKWKRAAVTNTVGKEGRKQDSYGEVEIQGNHIERERQKSYQSVTTRPTRKTKEKKNKAMSVSEWPADKRFVVPDESLGMSPLLFHVPRQSENQTEMLEGVDVATTTISNGMALVNSGCEGTSKREIMLKREEHADNVSVIDVDKLRELINMNPSEDSSSMFSLQQDSGVSDAGTLHNLAHCDTKSKTQLKMMKMAFSCCQYPNSEDYDHMGMWIGVPRNMLVKWFGDMRYYIKKIKPSWMNQEQHRQALGNIRYSQCLNQQIKFEGCDVSRERTRKRKPVRGSSGKDESVKVPPKTKLCT